MSVQEIRPARESIIPARIGKYGDIVIGDSEKSVSYTRGYTMLILPIEIESLMDITDNRCRNVLANVLGDIDLHFDSLRDEAESNIGRPAPIIAREEGPESYDQIKEHLPDNVYLHAALREEPVATVMEDMRQSYQPLVAEDGTVILRQVSQYNTDIISATGRDSDGEVYSQDLTEFVPDIEWVFEHGSRLNLNRSFVKSSKADEGDIDVVNELLEQPSDNVQPAILNPKSSWTVHLIREVEESIVEGEPDRFVYQCGRRKILNDDLIRFNIDVDKASTNHLCGNCTR